MENYNQRKINYKMLFLYIGIALAAGVLGALLGGNMDSFKELNKPSFAPPGILFPIVWTMLYILMGISTYLICCNKTDVKFKKRAFLIYIIQLIVNVLWTPIFFRFKQFLFAYVWIILLIFLVLYMIYKFYKIKPLAAYLQIPYIIWLLFASVLNLSIYFLN